MADRVVLGDSDSGVESDRGRVLSDYGRGVVLKFSDFGRVADKPRRAPTVDSNQLKITTEI